MSYQRRCPAAELESTFWPAFELLASSVLTRFRHSRPPNQLFQRTCFSRRHRSRDLRKGQMDKGGRVFEAAVCAKSESLQFVYNLSSGGMSRLLCADLYPYVTTA